VLDGLTMGFRWDPSIGGEKKHGAMVAGLHLVILKIHRSKKNEILIPDMKKWNGMALEHQSPCCINILMFDIYVNII
jgi:hypothetical protein